MILFPLCLSAATNDLTGALQRGLFEEEANRNLDAAAQAYQAVSAQFDKDRKLAATAIFRLGEVYRKQGRTNDAVAQYERIVREFSEEQTLVTLSRQNLAGLRQSPVFGDVPMLTGLGNASEEASRLAAQLKGIEQLKDNPEEQARAVLAFFPDEILKKMLLQLPKLKEQDAILRADPQADSTAQYEKLGRKLGNSNTANGSCYHTAFGPEGLTLEAHGTNLVTDAQREVTKQLSLIKERVDFTLSVQKARLRVEKQVQEISQFLEPLKAQQARDNRRTALRDRFEKKMAHDQDKYTPEQLREAEQLMRVADEKWGSPEANGSCQTIIKKYPDINRAGCAMLYLAQTSQGDERAKYLQDCIEKYNDCFYGDGVQVGVYARFLLAEDYKSKGEEKKAAALYSEIKAKYADAIDHRGNLLVDSIKADLK